MPVSRCGHVVEVELDADAALAGHLHARSEVSPAAPMSWMATMASVAISSRQASISSFSAKGSPTCTVGRFSSRIGGELGAGHGGAVDAVAAGLGADIDHGIADAGGGAERRCRSLRRDADGHGIDQRVAVVGGVEIDLAAHRRHADAIAVAADAAHHAVDRCASSAARPGAPKRSAFRLAIGRAPMVKTSRRMPPTPVAAPW